MANSIFSGDFWTKDIPEGAKTAIQATPGVLGGLSGRDYGYNGRYLNSDASFGEFNKLVESLKGLVPGLEEDRRSGTLYDLQRVFDEIHANNYCTFTKKMGAFMSRLMEININEKAILMDTLGQNAAYNGDSNILDPTIVRPSYAEGRNYLDYVDEMNFRGTGSMTTRTSDNISMPNYDDGNEIYRRTEWLYPDENDTGQFSNKWYAGLNRNSLLYKTKRLFAERKIKSLISRFGSNADPTSVDLDYIGRKGTTVGGESRGRNLLRRGGSGNYNGYNDPYCRVWTHHHQYDRISKLIRPFSGGDDNVGSPTTPLEDMHKYLVVGGDQYTGHDEIFENKGWRYSVLSKNGKSDYTGFVNIAPKFLGGGDMNIHPKQCMFSIENLAWRGYNPYEFEKALSWEQRGPLGGRIMWFPPYGLSFSETSNAQWSNNTFIGRGEDVYTYVNSQRSGNLSFLLVVDHPSVLDYATWHDAGRTYWGGSTETSGNGLTDEEVLQFFAGCDSGDPMDVSGSLFGKAKNTPLTDEYLREFAEQEIDVSINPVPKEVTPPDPEPEEDAPNGTEEMTFYVFFPNNYSGYYDYPTKPTGKVDAVLYLLVGTGAQTDTNTQKDIAIQDNDRGTGYECLDPLGDNPDYAIKRATPGTKSAFWGKTKTTKLSETTKWYYRIDTKESEKTTTVTPKGEERYKDQRCQYLTRPNGYKDLVSYGLNINKNAVKEAFSVSEETKLYSAASVFCSLMEKGNKHTAIKETVLKRIPEADKEDVTYLTDFFKNKVKWITNVKLDAFSSRDGASTSRGETRNSFLAQQRSNTIIEWLKQYIDIDPDKYKTVIEENYNSSKTDKSEGKPKESKQNENDKDSKKYRSVKVTIEFTTEASTDKAEAPATGASKGQETATSSANTTAASSTTQQGSGGSSRVEEVKNYLLAALQRNSWYSQTYKNKYKEGNGWDDDMDMLWAYVWTLSDLAEPKRLDYDEKEKGCVVVFNRTDFDCWKRSHEQFTKKGETNDEYYDRYLEDCIATDYAVMLKSVKESEAKELKDNAADYLNNLESTKESENEGEKTTDNTTTGDATKYERYTGYNQITPEGEFPRKFRNAEDGSIWYEVAADEENGTGKLRRIDVQVKSRFDAHGANLEGAEDSGKDDLNLARYDQEYYFFRQLERHDPIMFNRLIDRLKYFDPAFHSMTPEGFNARLTFLQQCTRQGSTISMSDKSGKTANNMAFGRSPFCVLRVGDFYNQMIVIDSINFDYSVSDGIVWDINPEGAGVQPMLCRVSMNFKFIGGGDLAGPIRRLQNAVSFNYYANTRLYDNRADRVRYNSENDWKLEGAVDWDIDRENSYSYNTAMYSDDKDIIEQRAKEVYEENKEKEKLVKKEKEEENKHATLADMENRNFDKMLNLDKIDLAANASQNSKTRQLLDNIVNKNNIDLFGNGNLV